MKNNILQFPASAKTPHEIVTESDASKILTDYKISLINEITDSISESIFKELSRAGMLKETDLEALLPSMSLVVESVRSLQFDSLGIEHPIQEFAYSFFAEEEVDSSETNDYNSNDNDKDK